MADWQVQSAPPPSGRLVQYAYDSKGRVNQVQTKVASGTPSWTVLASGLTYEPFGSVKTMTLGNGLSVANPGSGSGAGFWGNDGRLASRRLYVTSSGVNRSWLAYAYDANDNLGAIRDLVDNTKSAYYGYDPNDRMTLVSQVATAAPSAETYTYTAGTNRLATLVTSAGTRSITYDARGNTLSETRPASKTVAATYDGYGRLLTYTRTGDPAQTNVYNGLDDRVKATSASTAHLFTFDSDGRVLGEYGATTTAVIAETIWLDPQGANDPGSGSGAGAFGGDDGVGGYAPLAVGTGSGAGAALAWIHGNHLGVPIVYTDATGAAVTPAAYTMPGFPGQLKTLSDIYYNRYRDYDSSTGRYIQADPIGLGGGANDYLYAMGNPLSDTDPSGLEIGRFANGRTDLRDEKRPARRGSECPKPPPSPPIDWCGGSNWTRHVPEGNWARACKIHDECYGTLGANKHQCDMGLGKNLFKECKKAAPLVGVAVFCAATGLTYSLAVTALGGSFYRDGQISARGRSR